MRGIILCITFFACASNSSNITSRTGTIHSEPLYSDVSDEMLPVDALRGLSMDAHVKDIDDDGDLDIIIANEFKPNILLINDGSGKFTDESSRRLPRKSHDSEDIAIADFDGDGTLDILIVSEDDTENELYLNNGNGMFTDASDRLPVEGTSNAVLTADLNNDGLADIIIGNNGQNEILINQGDAKFWVETGRRLPGIEDVTQDIELGDADGDGDADLLVGNEDENRLLINDGTGVFTDESESRLVFRETKEETREADFGDIDNDGDLDIIFANVRAFVKDADRQNRLLVNDGTGHFTDETSQRLPAREQRSFDGDFFDLDEDGDLDLIFSNTEIRSSSPSPFTVYENNGEGKYKDQTGVWLPESAEGFGFDTEFADFNADGKKDLYLASRGSADMLLFKR